jgi:DNA repair exonuclease SbcCD ATPase subunit
MTRITWIGLGLLALLTTTVALQRRGLAEARQEQQALLAARQEAKQLAEVNRNLAAVPPPGEELAALRQGNRDLPSLRNEVRQMRDQRKDFERLQAENQRLAEQLKTPRKTITELAGFVARSNWVSSGFATPEAAVQTAFWAMNTHNFPALAECLEPLAREEMLEQHKKMTEEQRQRAAEEFGRLGTVKGFRIAEKNVESPDKVLLKIQVATDGELLEMTLRRHGPEWKLER